MVLTWFSDKTRTSLCTNEKNTWSPWNPTGSPLPFPSSNCFWGRSPCAGSALEETPTLASASLSANANFHRREYTRHLSRSLVFNYSSFASIHLLSILPVFPVQVREAKESECFRWGAGIHLFFPNFWDILEGVPLHEQEDSGLRVYLRSCVTLVPMLLLCNRCDDGPKCRSETVHLCETRWKVCDDAVYKTALIWLTFWKMDWNCAETLFKYEVWQ